MPLTITDEELARIELTPEQLRLEIAVMLREKDKMSYRSAAALAGLPVWDFKDVLAERGVPWMHYTAEMLEQDVESLERFRSRRAVPRESAAGGSSRGKGEGGAILHMGPNAEAADAELAPAGAGR